LFDLGKANYSLGKVDAAVSSIEGALDANGNFSSAVPARRFLELVQAQTDNARLAADLADAEKVLQSEPNDVPALMLKGANLARSGDSAGAVRTFEAVLRVYPDFSPADRQLVQLYASQPSTDPRASEMETKALAAFPNDPSVAKYCGIISYRNKEYRRAENLLSESANQTPDDAEVNFYLGMAQHSLNEKVSKESLERALKLTLPPELAAEAKQVLAGQNQVK
jgi:tetratricopeptide (TPR) repeat protein